MALVRAAAFLVDFSAETIAFNVLIEKFLALAAVFCFARYCTPFHSSLSVFGRT